jgi:hypothetical protein
MPTSYLSLLVGGATGWHTGNQNITYSYVGSELPNYYPQVDQNGDTVNDHYDMSSLDPSTALNLPLATTDFSMTPEQRALMELAVQAWNDVAYTNMVPGSIDSGGGTTGTPVTGSGTMVSGLGGPTGYGETALPRNDDGSTSVDISAVFEGRTELLWQHRVVGVGQYQRQYLVQRLNRHLHADRDHRLYNSDDRAVLGRRRHAQ